VLPRIRAAAVAVLIALGIASCASGQDQPARETADRFVAALAHDDGDGACGLLAPDTVSTVDSLRQEGCAAALPTLDLPHDPVADVEVWGDAAMARAGAATLFLRQGSDGWRVVAAGCRPPAGGDGPYECDLGGR
jgi:hypothetical protein